MPSARTLEAAEARGYADLLRAAPASLAAAKGITVREIAGVVCTAVARDDVNPRMRVRAGREALPGATD